MEPLKGPIEIVVGTRTGRYTLTNTLIGNEKLFSVGSPIDNLPLQD